MDGTLRNGRALIGAAAALIAVFGLVLWQTSTDSARWAAQQETTTPAAPIPETGHMRRRRGLK